MFPCWKHWIYCEWCGSFEVHYLFYHYFKIICLISSVPFTSVPQLCPTLCNPMDYSTPGLPVHHQLPEFTQTHVHWVGDAIQPFYPLSSPSPPAFNLSQHQGLFQRVSSSHQVAKVIGVSASVLPMNTQDWFPSGWTGWKVQSQSVMHIHVSILFRFLSHI